jgi:hypothetical protein
MHSTDSVTPRWFPFPGNSFLQCKLSIKCTWCVVYPGTMWMFHASCFRHINNVFVKVSEMVYFARFTPSWLFYLSHTELIQNKTPVRLSQRGVSFHVIRVDAELITSFFVFRIRRYISIFDLSVWLRERVDSLSVNSVHVDSHFVLTQYAEWWKFRPYRRIRDWNRNHSEALIVLPSSVWYMHKKEVKNLMQVYL